MHLCQLPVGVQACTNFHAIQLRHWLSTKDSCSLFFISIYLKLDLTYILLYITIFDFELMRKNHEKSWLIILRRRYCSLLPAAQVFLDQPFWSVGYGLSTTLHSKTTTCWNGSGSNKAGWGAPALDELDVRSHYVSITIDGFIVFTYMVTWFPYNTYNMYYITENQYINIL